MRTKSVVSDPRRVDQSREISLGILGRDLRNPPHAVTLPADLLLPWVRHGFPTTPTVLAATAAGAELTLAVRNQGTATF